MLRGLLLLAVAVTLLASSCAKNSITGRSQLLLVSEDELQTISDQQYRQFLSQHRVVNGSPQADMVKRVGRNISRAVTEFINKENPSLIKGYNWEFNLVEDKNINAWCMPGGKVVVYTGILPITQDENGMAIVMGHEIAHAVAKHGNERMSQGLVQQFGGIALSSALSSKPAATQELFLASYGLGSNVLGVLPFSRKQELEADRYGLIFAALAGYDPRNATAFWKRMAQASAGGQTPPEFLSTHPSDETRIQKVEQYAEEARKYYRK